MTDQPQKPTDPTEGAKPGAHCPDCCNHCAACFIPTGESGSPASPSGEALDEWERVKALTASLTDEERTFLDACEEPGKFSPTARIVSLGTKGARMLLALRAALSSLRGELAASESCRDSLREENTALREERDRLRGDLAAYGAVHARLERLEHENQALRAQAEKAEANVGYWKSRHNRIAGGSISRALDSAREALREATREMEARRDRMVAEKHEEAANAFDVAACRLREISKSALLSSAPPAPAPAPLTRVGPIIDPHPFVPGRGPQADENCGECGEDADSGVHRAAQREDAPTPEAPDSIPPGVKELAARNYERVNRHATPDLEGLIRETRNRVYGEFDPAFEETLDPILRSMASEVARLTREPLEQENALAWKVGNEENEKWMEAERKLAEVTQERDEARRRLKMLGRAVVLGSVDLPTPPEALLNWRADDSTARAQEDARGAQEGKDSLKGDAVNE